MAMVTSCRADWPYYHSTHLPIPGGLRTWTIKGQVVAGPAPPGQLRAQDRCWDGPPFASSGAAGSGACIAAQLNQGRRAVWNRLPWVSSVACRDAARVGSRVPIDDKGYDYPTCRQALRRRGIIPWVARRGVESNTRLGRHRWEVERSLACALICARKLRPL